MLVSVPWVFGVSSVFRVFPFCLLHPYMGTKQKETGRKCPESLRKGWITKGKQVAVNFRMTLS